MTSIRVALPQGLRLESGDTTWRGSSRGTVRIVMRVRAKDAGDIAVPVTQIYADGKVVHWMPVVHVAAAANANRDRLVILLLAGAVVVAFFALRRGRGQRS